MSTHDEIDARLTESSPVYTDINSLRKELQRLEQAEQAQAEYTQATSQFDDEINALTKRQKELETPAQPVALKDAGIKPFRFPAKTSAAGSKVQVESKATPSSVGSQPIERARTDLQKIIMRWGYVLKLSNDTRGQINRIADDPTRPLGEALALLDWKVFADRLGSETDKAHLERLVSWGGALDEYRERLIAEIDMLKIKYRLFIPILEAWLERDTESGRENWDKQIAETNVEKQKEVERLRNEIARLTARA